MQIKRFEAKNMTAALRSIKAELGADAVILSARSIKKRSGLLGTLKNSGVEVTAATDTHIRNEKDFRQTSRAGYGDQTIEFRRHGTQKPVSGAGDDYRKVGALTEDTAPNRMNSFAPSKQYLFDLYQQLIYRGVDPNIAGDLTEGLKLIPNAARRLSRGESEPLLTGLLEHMGLRSEPIRLDSSGPQVFAFVGTSGTGKTTSVVKLAAHFAIARKKTVALITCDDVRIGALEQIRLYAKIIGVPLAEATHRSDLKAQLKRFKNLDLVLVDTPGLNPKDDEQIRNLQILFAKVPNLQTQLVVSAATKEEDLLDTVKCLQGFERCRLLFTRLDETGSGGSLLNLLIRSGLPISYISDGPQVPDNIRPASLAEVIRILVQDPKVPDTRNNFVPASRSAVPSQTAKPAEQEAIGTDTHRGAAFVANRNSDVYHVAGCKWTKKIKSKHMITFETAAAAARLNFLPCRNCNPDRNAQPAVKAFEGNHHLKVNATAYGN
jgi:flagellar biosynthesis protein FlhF